MRAARGIALLIVLAALGSMSFYALASGIDAKGGADGAGDRDDVAA